jgi:hypothetical protein
MTRWYSNETQIRWACRELLRGREISHAHEIAEANGWRLSAIIHNLRHRYNWPISTRYGLNRIAYYKLGNEVDKLELEKPRSFYKKKKPTH